MEEPPLEILQPPVELADLLDKVQGLLLEKVQPLVKRQTPHGGAPVRKGTTTS